MIMTETWLAWCFAFALILFLMGWYPCCCTVVEPCVNCATGTTPATITVTITANDTPPSNPCDTACTGIFGTHVLPPEEGVPCTWFSSVEDSAECTRYLRIAATAVYSWALSVWVDSPLNGTMELKCSGAMEWPAPDCTRYEKLDYYVTDDCAGDYCACGSLTWWNNTDNVTVEVNA
jgi:hypothetical protein